LWQVANIKPELKEDEIVIIDATEMRSEATYARMVNLDPDVRYNAEFVVVEVNKRYAAGVPGFGICGGGRASTSHPMIMFLD
jgi:hypothetical protein